MVEQKVIWTCEVCKEVYIADEGICLCGGTISPVIYVRKDEQVERVNKSVFIEHLTEKQQKELWEALYG